MARIGKWTTVNIDDSTPTARDLTNDITEIDGLPTTYDEIEASGFGQDHGYVVGQGDSGFTITGKLTTTALTGTHTVLSGIVGDMSQTYTVTVAYGNNAAPTTGDPEFEGEFYCSSYAPGTAKDGLQTFTAKFVVAQGQALPAWGTVA